MSRDDRKAGELAASQAWLASPRLAPAELQAVPPCRICGRTPAQYSRFDNGTVQCLDRRDCEGRGSYAVTLAATGEPWRTL